VDCACREAAHIIQGDLEVKRSSDTRIRREVVGQMLDYAANGASFVRRGDTAATTR
jgi:hypothetical protein